MSVLTEQIHETFEQERKYLRERGRELIGTKVINGEIIYYYRKHKNPSTS